MAAILSQLQCVNSVSMRALLYQICHKLTDPRHWKTSMMWSECVKTGVSKCGQSGVDPQDRDA